VKHQLFAEILYTDADYYSEETKVKNLQNQNGGLTPYWKSVFGDISTAHCPICFKFCSVSQKQSITKE